MNAGSAHRVLDTLLALDGELRRTLRLGQQPDVPTLDAAIVMSEKTIDVALSARPEPDSSADIARASLIAAVLDAQAQVQELILQTRSRRIPALARVVTRMRSAASVEALIRQTCSELTGTLEFRRASYSVVDGTDCILRYAHPHAESPLPDGTRHRKPTAAERDCIAQRRSVLVDAGAPGHRRDHIAEIVGATRYVVAPVIVGGEVCALLHAARELPWAVDRTDIQLLDIVAATFAVIHEREVRSDRMQRQRQNILAAVRQLATETDSFAGLDVDLGLDGASIRPGSAAQPLRAAVHELLTPREAEVLGLIVDGASNNEIAEQLVITVETVKSHVKQVLRKLGAVNRSEAISLYLEEQRRAGKTP
ncbi:LuxR C-terminal-related transcriptional regulator [Nocardia nova]|jgi:DNA-binding CsgD family transcriptional regulator|uniref:LuxR C-terminal-related transcriptional regulator n=1 Tax=Nocardia nova TaxID=37330 RepID=UPI0007A3BC73|nr:LuxR C-terminal-related transcriptional regulator [Nocardia nova]